MPTWGICFGPAWGTSVAELVEPAREAEARGFDRIAVGEYHNDALAWLQALAAATRTPRVATTILNVSLRHPSIVGEAVAAIRDAYGDRVDLGIGLSHAQIVEEELGLALADLDYLEEYAEAVRSVQLCLPFVGKRIRATPPLARHRVVAGAAPLFVAALRTGAVRRAAHYADGLVLTWVPARRAGELAASARAVAKDRGCLPAGLMVVLPCFQADDPLAARRAAASLLLQYVRLPAYGAMLADAGWSDEVGRALAVLESTGNEVAAARELPAAMLDEVALVGGRDQLEAQLTALSQAGVDELVLYPLDTGDGWRAAVDRCLLDLAPA
jgi:5,10-methylenetetrahydromethanopterin reductase